MIIKKYNISFLNYKESVITEVELSKEVLIKKEVIIDIMPPLQLDETHSEKKEK